jgi:hypothetical protein
VSVRYVKMCCLHLLRAIARAPKVPLAWIVQPCRRDATAVQNRAWDRRAIRRVAGVDVGALANTLLPLGPIRCNCAFADRFPAKGLLCFPQRR